MSMQPINHYKLFLWLAVISTTVYCCKIVCRESYYLTNKCTIDGTNYNLSSGLNSIVMYTQIQHLKVINTEHIPLWIFNEIPDLLTLDMSNNHVSNIPNSIFTLATKLQIINLSHNNITKLEEWTFNDADEMKHINLSHNQIKLINMGVFKNLIRLEKIDLSHNMIITLSQIGMIPKNVKIFILNNNQLENFTLPDSVYIDTVNLDFNHLKYLNINTNVRTLHASNNRLTNVNINSLNSKIGILLLRNNSINNLNFIKSMSNLTDLDLSSNSLDCQNVDSRVFAKLLNLKKLNLKSVELNHCNMELLSELYSLESLDISNNNLVDINFDRLSGLVNLNELYINNNNLANLTLNEFDYLFPNLKLIDISENNWQCLNLKNIFAKFKLLNIRVQINEDNLPKNRPHIRRIQCQNLETQNDIFLEPVCQNLTMINEITKRLDQIISNQSICNTSYILVIVNTVVVIVVFAIYLYCMVFRNQPNERQNPSDNLLSENDN